MAARRGMDFKLYIDSEVDPDGYFSDPSWSLVNDVKDVSRKLEKVMADASIRGNIFRQQQGTLKDLSLEFEMVYDPDDPSVQALEAAFWSDDNVQVASLDGDINTEGSKGIRFIAQVSQFGQDEPLEDMGKIPVTFVVGYDPENEPTRVVVNTPGTLTPVTP